MLIHEPVFSGALEFYMPNVGHVLFDMESDFPRRPLGHDKQDSCSRLAEYIVSDYFGTSTFIRHILFLFLFFGLKFCVPYVDCFV